MEQMRTGGTTTHLRRAPVPMQIFQTAFLSPLMFFKTIQTTTSRTISLYSSVCLGKQLTTTCDRGARPVPAERLTRYTPWWSQVSTWRQRKSIAAGQVVWLIRPAAKT